MKTPRTHPQTRQSGNVMIYILLALVLIGALTVALTRQGGQGGDDLSYEQAELHASELIAYSLAAQNVLNQMVMSGTEIDDLNYIYPSEATFNTAPNINKIFHPQGGGLSYKAAKFPPFDNMAGSPPAGWYIGMFSTVQWTATSQQEVILTAYKVTKRVCESINKKITGSTAIPPTTVSLSSLLVKDTSNNNMTTTNCPGCEGYTSMCISNSAATGFAFYTILEAR